MVALVALTRLLLVCLAVILLLPAAAFADETEEANRLVDEASALLEQDQAQYAEFVDLIVKAEQIDPASKKAAEALVLLNEASASLDELTRRMQSIAALVDEAKALDISPEYKVYFGKERELMQANLDLYAVLGEVTAKDKTAYAQWDRLSRSERSALATELSVLGDRAAALETETQETGTAAAQYYEDKGLGEASSGSTFWVPGVLVFAAVGLLIGWYVRRRRHQGPTSPKALDEEMRGV